MKSLDERSHTFVIRIWQERRDLSDAMPIWRGRVDDVRTGSRAYFTSLQQLMEYLSGRSLMEADSPAPLAAISPDSPRN
jgi:hypothetical protein